MSLWSGIGHVFSDVFGAAIGVSIVDAGWREMLRHAAKKTAEVVHENTSVAADVRERVLKDIMRLQEEGQHLLDLLKEANRDGFIKVGEQRYLEARIVDLLSKIAPQDREWVYRGLDAVCEADREGFFALLGIVNDDGMFQVLKMGRSVLSKNGKTFRDAMRSIFTVTGHGIRDAATALDAKAGQLAQHAKDVNNKLEFARALVRAWANR